MSVMFCTNSNISIVNLMSLFVFKAQLSHVWYSSYYPTRLEAYCVFGMHRKSTGDWILSSKQKWWSLREVHQGKANSGQSIA